MNRRKVLATTGSVLGSLPTGCLGNLTDRNEIKLSSVSALNLASEPHTISVRVHRDDELVHESAHELEGSNHAMVSGASVECEWEEVPGEFIVSARLDSGDWTKRDMADGTDADCVEAHVTTDQAGVAIGRIERCVSLETGECVSEGE